MINRITVVQHVYHQSEDSGEPLAVDSTYGRQLMSGEELYTRTIKVGTAEIPLDLGWVPVQDSGLLLISNAGDKNTVEVLVNGVPFAVILPGESARWSPHQNAIITIRSPGGASKLNVVSVPK